MNVSYEAWQLPNKAIWTEQQGFYHYFFDKFALGDKEKRTCFPFKSQAHHRSHTPYGKSIFQNIYVDIPIPIQAPRKLQDANP